MAAPTEQTQSHRTVLALAVPPGTRGCVQGHLVPSPCVSHALIPAPPWAVLPSQPRPFPTLGWKQVAHAARAATPLAPGSPSPHFRKGQRPPGSGHGSWHRPGIVLACAPPGTPSPRLAVPIGAGFGVLGSPASLHLGRPPITCPLSLCLTQRPGLMKNKSDSAALSRTLPSHPVSRKSPILARR